LAAIDDALRSVTDGAGLTLVISAEAGAGKSAILQHARSAARGLHLPAITVAAVAGDARPFGPWAALYEQLVGVPFSSSSTASGDASALAVALQSVIAPRTCLLVDDAQYLRGDALHVLILLARGARASAHAVFVALRSEGLRALLVHLDAPVRLDLAPLTSDELREGLRRIAPDDAAAVATFVHARSGGNPFFASRVFEALLREGTLQRVAPGRWALTAPIADDAQTPSDLREYIEARLFARGEGAATVACALALDAEASADDLVAVCGLGEASTLDAIDDLLALALIEQDEHGAVRFTHDLVRDTAAQCLNGGRRARLHRAFVDRFAGDERRATYVRLARHLHASGQLLAGARAYADAAGSLLAANAWRDALLAVKEGIELANQLRESVDVHAVFVRLHEIAVRAYEEGGARETALDHANQRVLHARKADDLAALSRALARRAWSIMETRAPDEALPGLDEALALAQQLGDDDLAFYARMHRSLYYQYTGDEQRAIGDAHAAIAAADRLDEAEARTAGRDRLIASACIWLRLDDAEAAAGGTTARVAISQAEMLFGVRRACLWYLRDRLEASHAELDEVARALGAPHLPPALVRGMILPLIQYAFSAQAAVNARAEGRWNDALAHAERLVENPLAEGYTRRGIARLHLIEALLGRNAIGDVARAGAEIARLPRDAAPPNLFGMSLTRESAVARIAVASGSPDAADLVREAGDVLKHRARRAPLDVDLALEQLAAAARTIGMDGYAAHLLSAAAPVRMRRAGPAGPPEHPGLRLVR